MIERTHDLVMSAFDHLSSCSCGPVRVGDFSDPCPPSQKNPLKQHVLAFVRPCCCNKLGDGPHGLSGSHPLDLWVSAAGSEVTH